MDDLAVSVMKAKRRYWYVV